ncbi:MAG TPA: alpha-glucosidase [Candidatus Limnocylindrales bacterium]|nr:alpha-glucosidase [Candidatus Limnocylindrales bacterium]
MSEERSSPGATGIVAGDDWWQTGVVYQIYPRSFADSTGDGVGDLAGIETHLDHLGPDGLAVDAIWLSPIYPSPGLDLGYDVADHAAVDPLFGSMAEFESVVAAAHDRGIRVLLDLVMNHTSHEHPWFRASRAGRTGAFADWYIWRDPAGFDRRGRPRPPNNWLSWFGGSGWTWDEGRGQFYFHTFLAEQPDLNWRNPAVPAAQLAIVKGWLDRGVDGFRLDVFNRFFKRADLAPNPSAGFHRQAWYRQRHVNDENQPELGAFLAEFRAEIDRRPGRMTVGELFGGGAETAASYAAERHLIFDFVLLEQPWSARAFAAGIDRVERAFGPDRWPTVVLSNHDRPRHASRLAAAVGVRHRDAVAKAAAVILLTLRGTPFLYYGEELGLGDIVVPRSQAIDPPARRASWFFPWWNRDGCRSPMPWTSGPNAGFAPPGTATWLPLAPDATTRNVERQAADPESVLSTYRRLLAARRALAPLRSGSFRRLEAGHRDVLAWVREAAADQALVVVNFAARPIEAHLRGAEDGAIWHPVAGTHLDLPGPIIAGRPVALRPLEGVIAVHRG